MSFLLRLSFVVVFALAAPVTAGAGPGRHDARPIRQNIERPPSQRGATPGVPAVTPPRRPEAQRPPPSDLWNPLKRKRMAMPAPPAAPGPGGDYAF